VKRLGAVFLAAATVAVLAAAAVALRKLGAAQEEFSAAVGPDAAEKAAATRRADAIWNALMRRGAGAGDTRPTSVPSDAVEGR
jgi:hypothetical protein